MLPDYWLERPPLDVDSSTHAAIDDFLSLGQPEAGAGPLDVDPIVHGRGGDDASPDRYVTRTEER